jgi:hypothetical protein
VSAHDPDLIRRIQLERADAAKQALDRGIQKIKNYKVKSELYRKALKTSVRLLLEEMTEY